MCIQSTYLSFICLFTYHNFSQPVRMNHYYYHIIIIHLTLILFAVLFAVFILIRIKTK